VQAKTPSPGVIRTRPRPCTGDSPYGARGSPAPPVYAGRFGIR